MKKLEILYIRRYDAVTEVKQVFDEIKNKTKNYFVTSKLMVASILHFFHIIHSTS